MTAYQPPGRRRLNTVREVIEDFLSRGYTASKGQVLKDSRYVLLGFIAAKGDVRIDDLIADDLEKWIEEHKAWESDWTRMRVAATVKRAFSWAWRKGLIDRHPFVGVNYRPGNRGQPMSDEHFRLPAAEADAPDGALSGKKIPMPRHHGLHEYKKLQAELRAAQKRYRKAERSLARMKAQRGELYRKTYEIERLRTAAKERNKLLAAALKRIEQLEGRAAP